MAKFRKKPIVVEAEQWFPGVEIDGTCEIPGFGNLPGSLIIETPEGEMRARPGDWIITGVKGERYPCKPDIFEMTYEKVEE